MSANFAYVWIRYKRSFTNAILNKQLNALKIIVVNSFKRSAMPQKLFNPAIDEDNFIDINEAALKENKKDYKAYMYANANHGFHNDTTPRFDKASAELAWQRTIDFFKDKLK